MDVARRWFEGVANGELPFELSDPELRIDNVPNFPTRGPYHGHEGFRRWWHDIAEAFAELHFELEKMIEVDDERILAVHRMVGRFRSTDLPVDTLWASLISVRNGKVTGAVGYASEGRARGAAGLPN